MKKKKVNKTIKNVMEVNFMIQSARKSHLNQVQASFALQAAEFESPKMSFSKQDYLAHTIQNISPHGTELVLEAAAGTCACGRSLAPSVSSVICLDATAPMLQVGKIAAKKDLSLIHI